MKSYNNNFLFFLGNHLCSFAKAAAQDPPHIMDHHLYHFTWVKQNEEGGGFQPWSFFKPHHLPKGGRLAPTNQSIQDPK